MSNHARFVPSNDIKNQKEKKKKNGNTRNINYSNCNTSQATWKGVRPFFL